MFYDKMDLKEGIKVIPVVKAAEVGLIFPLNLEFMIKPCFLPVLSGLPHISCSPRIPFPCLQE